MITNIAMGMQSILRLISLMLFSLCVQAQQWQLDKQVDHVEVYSRETASGYVEIKAVTTANAKSWALLRLLDDTNNAPNWIANCKQVKTLEWFGQYQRTVQTFFNAPWPISDRDMITYSEARFNPADASLVIDITDKAQHYPRQTHIVRMQNVRGTWTVVPLSDEKIKITYVGYGEAGGSLPPWLANKLIIASTFDTFKALRQHIGKPSYQRPLKRLITE